MNKKLLYTAVFIFFYQAVSCIKQPYISSYHGGLGFPGMNSVLFAGMGAFLSSSLVTNILTNAFDFLRRLRDETSTTRIYDLFMTTFVVGFSLLNSLLFMTIFIRDRVLLDFSYKYIYFRLCLVIIVANFFVLLITRHINNKGVGNGLWMIHCCKYLESVLTALIYSPASFDYRRYLSIFIMFTLSYIIINYVSSLVISLRIHALHSDSINISSYMRRKLTQDYFETNASRNVLLANVFVSHLKNINFFIIGSAIFKRWFSEKMYNILSYGVYNKILIFSVLLLINYMYSEVSINPNEMSKNLIRQSVMLVNVRNDKSASRLFYKIVMLNTVVVTLIQGFVIIVMSKLAALFPYSEEVFKPIDIFILVNTMKLFYKRVVVERTTNRPAIVEYLNIQTNLK